MEPSKRDTKDSKKRTYLFFAAMAALPSRVAAWLSASLLGRFFGGYGKSCELLSESRIAQRTQNGRLRRLLSTFCYRTATLSAGSRPLLLLRMFFDAVRQTKTRVYGVFLTTFGVYTALVYAIKYFFFTSEVTESSIMITALGLLIFGLPMLLSSRPLHAALIRNPLSNFIFVHVAGLRIYARSGHEHLHFNGTFAFIIGSVFGLIGFFVHPLYLIGGLGAVILFFLCFQSPEFCLISAMFLVPFLSFLEHPTLVLAVFVLAGLVSYTVKLILGKRLLSIEPMDIAVLCLMALYLLSCFFTRGGQASVTEALLCFVLIGGYFLAVNLLSSATMLFRAVRTLLLSGGIVALIGVLQKLTGNAIPDWLDPAAYAYTDGRITSTLSNPNVLAVFLILLLPFAMAMMVRRSPALSRLFAFLTFALLVAAIVLTQSRGAWIGVLAATVVFILICRPGAIYALIPIGIGAPFAVHFLLPSLLERFSSGFTLADSSVFYRTGLWQGVFNLLGENFLGGIGVGESAFRTVYPYYAVSGTESAPHAHSLYLDLFCSFGVLGLLVFLFLILLFFQCLFTHRRSETDDRYRFLGLAAGCSVFAVLINGLTDCVFYNHRILFLFFTVVGIGVAAARVGRKEKRRRSYEDERSADSYAVDIPLAK